MKSFSTQKKQKKKISKKLSAAVREASFFQFPIAYTHCKKCRRTITKKEFEAGSHPCR